MLQERWKVTAEQAKTESTQRSLEEERRTLTLQMSMEREELERAKVRLMDVHVGVGGEGGLLSFRALLFSIRAHCWRSRSQ